jgi:hypothetical protein
MINNYKDIIFNENQIYDIYIKKNLVIQKKMIELIELKVYNLNFYVLNLRDEEKM